MVTPVQKSSPAPLSPQATALKAAVSDTFAGLTRVLSILDEHPGAIAEVKREVAGHLTTALKLRLMQIFL